MAHTLAHERARVWAMNTHTNPNPSTPVCPLDLEPGQTYTDKADGSTFTVHRAHVKGAGVKVITTTNERFTYGGLYRGLRLVTDHPTTKTTANKVGRGTVVIAGRAKYRWHVGTAYRTDRGTVALAVTRYEARADEPVKILRGRLYFEPEDRVTVETASTLKARQAAYFGGSAR